MTKSEPDYIPLQNAYTYAVKALRVPEFAAAALKEGFHKGTIRATAQIILKEYACGTIRSFNRRRQIMQLGIIERPEGADLFIKHEYLRRAPKGAQLLCNWRSGHLAWIAPMPTRYSVSKVSGKPRATLPIRFVMYDVEVEAASIQRIVQRLVGNDRISETLRTRVPAAYNTDEKWRELLPKHFLAADTGRLDEFFPYDQRGGRAAFWKAMRIVCPSIKSDATAKRILRHLIRLDKAAVSARIQREQQLTNS